MKWFALANDGLIYNLCDCGDFEAAEESAEDLFSFDEPLGAVWIIDEDGARQWMDILQYHLKD